MDTIAEEFIPPILCQPNPLQVLEGEPEHEEVLRVRALPSLPYYEEAREDPMVGLNGVNRVPEFWACDD
jgi:hypothetical protein